jgi:hypothetical protein
VSATVSDSRARCNPYNVVDPNGYGWWAPAYDVGHAAIGLIFPRAYTVQKIKIKWKLKPPKVEIRFMYANYGYRWKTILLEEPSDDIDLEIVPEEIMGLDINMLDLNYPKKDGEEAPQYGIKKIEISRPGTALSLQTCAA